MASTRVWGSVLMPYDMPQVGLLSQVCYYQNFYLFPHGMNARVKENTKASS
jgi:hypothetical protein